MLRLKMLTATSLWRSSSSDPCFTQHVRQSRRGGSTPLPSEITDARIAPCSNRAPAFSGSSDEKGSLRVLPLRSPLLVKVYAPIRMSLLATIVACRCHLRIRHFASCILDDVGHLLRALEQ